MIWPFENDTSGVEKKLAGRSLKADRRRSIFTVMTIALAVCLMGTLCFLYSAQQKKTLDAILGQYQAGCDGLTREEVLRLVDAGQHQFCHPGYDGPDGLRGDHRCLSTDGK